MGVAHWKGNYMDQLMSSYYYNINFPLMQITVYFLTASVRIFDSSAGSYRSGSKGNSFTLVGRISC